MHLRDSEHDHAFRLEARAWLEAHVPLLPPPPPAGFHAEYVLAAVIADRRRRDAERLAREDQRLARLLPPDPFA